MENKGPYRIYDPGGITCELLVKPNTDQKESMERIMSLGDLLEESQREVHKLRQKVETLVKDNELLRSSSPLDPVPETSPSHKQLETGQEHPQDLCDNQAPKMSDKDSDFSTKSSPKSSPVDTSSEFEFLNGFESKKRIGSHKSDPGPTFQNEGDNLQLHLQRLESSLSMCAEEPVRDRLLAHLSRMALDFNRLANKVHKNELRTSVMQTLCEQLRKENEDLREKLEADWKQRNKTEQALRNENLELRKLIMQSTGEVGKGVQVGSGTDLPLAENLVENTGQQQMKVENTRQQQVKVENTGQQQVKVEHGAQQQMLEKQTSKDPSAALLKKVKVLEHQRAELLDVNKQWDQQFRSMKLQYEEKITSLRQKLSQALKTESEHEADKDRRQRDYDRKLLLARDKIEEKESQIQKLEYDMKELKQNNKYLYEQLNSIRKQRDYQEREISRLNKALEEALNRQETGPRSPSFTAFTENTDASKQQELMLQNDILKQQVKIFEEDFQKERRDRERMNEEKEELKKQMEELQTQLGQVNTQLRTCKDDLLREKEISREALRQQALGERYFLDHYLGGPMCPPYKYPFSPPAQIYPGFDDWQICYPPPAVPPEHSQVQDLSRISPPAYQWRNPSNLPRGAKGTADMLRHKKQEPDVPSSGTPATQRPT
ncbi:TNFAIP3-interacting protein 1 isoform X2 [Bombina bombina]|uniref:TNFAIP3-interacting protein 1 isoform X2 n=1 Tax=Bombina bombina TaxID=8345 RepID=UPI00235AA42B|nr:TNFAIP3-interacting protein 1 isoform X2 [Bombina bombina]